MGIAMIAYDLGTNHAVARVAYGAYIVSGQRQPETRPTGSRVIFVLGTEQIVAAADTPICTVVLQVDVRAGEWPLRTLHLRHLVLLFRQPRFEVVAVVVFGVQWIPVFHLPGGF